MKTFTAYWLDSAALPPEAREHAARTRSPCSSSSATRTAHLPVQQALKAIERPRYAIHWVTSEEAAHAALDEHPHDAFLVDADTGGLQLAKQILVHTPHAPVLLLDDAPTATPTSRPPRPASPST